MVVDVIGSHILCVTTYLIYASIYLIFSVNGSKRNSNGESIKHINDLYFDGVNDATNTIKLLVFLYHADNRCYRICLYFNVFVYIPKWLYYGGSNKIIPILSIIILLAAFLFSFRLLLNNKDSELAMSYVLYLIFTTQFNDAIQYFVGKKFGKHQLCPTISPNKTVEGAIGGGLIVSLLATVVALSITPFSLISAMVISFTLTVLGVSGDVSVSWVKRKFGVKDMGDLLPGHGGILDRIDSLLLATPIFFFIVELLRLH